MTQPLWYLRRDAQVTGPFPTPQINEALRKGEVSLDDEVSLDRQQWLTIRESGHFGAATHVPPAQRTEREQDEAWRAEREKARQRWLKENGEAVEPVPGSGSGDLRREAALRLDHQATETMLLQARGRRPSWLIGVAGVVLLTGLGALMWFGQGDKGIQPRLSKTANCASPAAEGVVWRGCDKTNAKLAGSHLRNADLLEARLNGADLSGADLAYINAERGQLRGANLQRAVLLGAKLDRADLTGADLRGADLRYATLQGALLEGARLDGASLGKATWIDGHQCGEDAVGGCP